MTDVQNHELMVRLKRQALVAGHEQKRLLVTGPFDELQHFYAIEQAAQAIAPYIHRTPLLTSRTISGLVGSEGLVVDYRGHADRGSQSGQWRAHCACARRFAGRLRERDEICGRCRSCVEQGAGAEAR